MTQSEIQEKIKDIELKRAASEKWLNAISNARLLIAALIILACVAKLKLGNDPALFAAGFGVVAFMGLVTRFRQVSLVIEQLDSLLAVLGRYEKRANDDWNDFYDDGSEFLTPGEHVSEDLDIFGKNSLYQYISVAHTVQGRKALARLLISPSLEHINARQDSVRELANDLEFALQFEALGYEPNARNREHEKEAEQSLRQFAKGELTKHVKYAQLIGQALPILTLASFAAFFFSLLPIYVPLALVGLQIGISILLASDIAQQKDASMQFFKRLLALNVRLNMLCKQSYESAYLVQMKEHLKDAPVGIRRLSTIISLWSWRENFILYFLLCGVFAWDFNCLHALERWRKVYGQSFCLWQDWLGEAEALLSLSTIGRMRDDADFAQIVQTEEPFLDMVGGAHPLLRPSKVVVNDYQQKGETVIITGSNMSGKSTFMRTLGLNAVLAYAGGMTCARRFAISPMRILTSMRVRDDALSGISTFYGELLRIKEMADYAERKKPLLILVDEIFKGTNSADRIIGASAAIRKLSRPWMMTMVTTHDFELCALVEENGINGKNYHFEEHYRDNEIFFDYKIRPDRCHTTNAQALMRMAGLMDATQ